ncbi:MAG: hypothetical protein M1816_002935 [Peltula sp. TS41687]|nr:MAG: hypothetical protein M1816_002935 [Peltula sp. TS41687]
MLIGTMNLLFATLGLVYQQHYHFSPGLASLTYLGMTIGFVVGAFGFGKTSDHISIQLTRKRGGKTEPEYRLPAWMLGSPLVVAGLFWYGWALQAHTFWLIPIFGLTLVGLGTTAMQPDGSSIDDS